MQVTIHDKEALEAISPMALNAYARSLGWHKQECYRKHSHVYLGQDRPEIIVPQTDRLGDYASVVSTLIKIFAQVADQDELTVYQSLATGDRDVVRIRVADSDDGSLGLNQGVDLVRGARDLIQSAACSLYQKQAVYRAGANQIAKTFLEQMRLGQTDQGSFVVTVLTPPVVPQLLLPLQLELPSDSESSDPPIPRQITQCLVKALQAVRESIEWAATGEPNAFATVPEKGVSANLCDALVRLIGTSATMDVGVSWARTWPRPTFLHEPVRFSKADSPFLEEAARGFRNRAPQEGVELYGFVQRLARPETDDDGTIRLLTHISGKKTVVQTVLGQRDYEEALKAHKDKAVLTLKGNLERRGPRKWQLLDAQVESILPNEEVEEVVLRE